MRTAMRTSMVLGLMASWAGVASAQSGILVTLPDISQTTTLTATVTEQARVTVPSGVTFNVTDVTSSTVASAASVSISNIALASATKTLRLSLQASAASFTPPVTGATTWSAGDVSWNASTWTNATGVTGALSTSYSEVATCAADAANCSSTGLVFTLASKSTVKRSGNHTLAVTWKFESIGS
jgi:hypothetical protein